MRFEYVIKYEAKQCPRCNGEFTCKPKNISQCDCMKVRISPEEQNFISENFSTCVCNNCLKELKQEYYLNYQRNQGENINV